MGTCKLLSNNLIKKQLQPNTTNLKPFNSNFYYGMGILFNNGWVYHNGGLPGYNNMCSYLPSKKTSIIISINKQTDKIKTNLADIVFVEIAKTLFPEIIPTIGTE